MDKELERYIERRDALLRNPTLEAATAWWRGAHPRDSPLSPLTPLASVHKARLQWLDATDAMIAESLAWLKEHDWSPSMAGTPPLTPESRDAQRAILGKPPLRSA
jgi:hypothetical protein